MKPSCQTCMMSSNKTPQKLFKHACTLLQTQALDCSVFMYVVVISIVAFGITNTSDNIETKA